MSLFSQKQTVPQDSFLESEAIIKTMQDDIDALNGITRPKASSSKPDADPMKVSADKDTKQTNSAQNPFMQTDTTKTPTVEMDTPKQNVSRPTPSTSHIPMISFVILIILILAGGAYYFATTRSMPETPGNDIETAEQQNTVTETPQESAPIFSKETPNYLPIDTTQTTPESIRELLRKTARDSAALGSTKPVEFILTDESNNPLSFASFATMSGMTLSSPVMNTLGGKFSLFMFTDQGSTHAGISVETTDKQASLDALMQKESSLAQDLSPLFLGDSATKTENVFAATTYKNIPVRFLNLHPETMLSIDYSATDTHVVVGTSMKTHRAIIDTVNR